MKKVGVGLLFFCCCVALVVLLLSRQEEEVVAAEFLPENVLFYAEQQDFSFLYQEFQHSRLGRTLASLDYSGVAAELGVSEEKNHEFEAHRLKISDFLASPAFQELFGKEFSVALFPANSFSAENPTRALEERLLLIARPRHNAEVLQFLTPLFTGDIQQATVRYGSHTITRYQMDEQRILSTVMVKGMVLAGFDERLVRKSLDCYDDKQNTLQQNKEFQRLRQSLKQAKLFIYLSLPALCEQGHKISEKLPKEDQEMLLILLDQWQGWGEAAYGAWQEEDLIHDKAVIIFDSQELDSRVAELCGVKPTLNNTLTMVPTDVLFYYWTNTFNLPLIWDLYSSRLPGQAGDLDVLRQEVREATGVELEALLAMVGKEFAFLIRDIDANGIPLPKTALVVQLNEPESFIPVFENLLSAAEIPISKKKYGDEIITYWGLAPQGGLQPAFTVQGEYLLLSNSIDVIKQIVDLKNDPKKSFLENSDIQRVGSGLLFENNSAAYIDIAGLADVLKDIASWTASMAILQGPEAARTSHVLLEQIILPLLDGFAMYSKLGSRSIIGKDTIMLESTTSVIQ